MPDRESLGRLVRETWVNWAREQSSPKPGWLTGWDDLEEGQREVDMRIGEAVAAAERERIAEFLRSVQPAGFLIRHGLHSRAGASLILLAVAAEIEGSGEDHTEPPGPIPDRPKVGRRGQQEESNG